MIPDKYQVFDSPVSLSDKDQQRLGAYLSGWNRLVAQLIEGVNKYDCQRLVVMELMGKQREPVINKLLVKLSKMDRERIERRIELCLKKN